MNRNTILLIFSICVASAYTAYTNRFSSVNGEPDNVGKKQAPMAKMAAPDFDLTDLKGKKHKLSDYRGKGIVLNFWATWCGPCVEEFPQLIELAQQTKETTIFIFLSVDDEQATVEKFLKNHAINTAQENVIVSLDKDKSISQDIYQSYQLPETYLINKDGLITEKVIGFVEPWNSPEMVTKFKGLAAAKN